MFTGPWKRQACVAKDRPRVAWARRVPRLCPRYICCAMLGATPAAAADPALIAAAREEGQVTWYTSLIVNQLGRPAMEAFQKRYGIRVNLVRADSVELAARILNEAQAGRLPPAARQAEARVAATYITEIAQRVTTVAFQAAGGGALFDTNPLQRCFRDIAAAAQHFMVSQSAYRALGQFKLDQPDTNPML